MVYIEDITRWREDMSIIFERLFSTRENNIHILKLPCNVLFIIWSEVGTSEQRTYKSRRKTHALFTGYIFFHISLLFTFH